MIKLKNPEILPVLNRGLLAISGQIQKLTPTVETAAMYTALQEVRGLLRMYSTHVSWELPELDPLSLPLDLPESLDE